MFNSVTVTRDRDPSADLYPNSEELERLYDPDHVRRVTLTSAGSVQVCVDARMLNVEAGTGVATYARMLADCLPGAGARPAIFDGRAGDRPRRRLARWISALDGQPRTIEGRPVGDEEAEDPSAANGWLGPDLFHEAQVFFNLHGRLMPITCAQPPQVMHWTYPTPLYVRGARNLYTVHDLIPLTDPQLTRISERRHRRLLEQIRRHAHGLVTVTETVRADLIEHLGCAPDFVANTYQAAHVPLQRDPPPPAGLRSGRYFLFCGTVEPRKNLVALIAAHALSGAPLPLVIVGPSSGAEDLEALIARQPNVIRLPWQPRSTLIGLIRRARALLFPSLAEGFGLPIVEAMTLGAPVMTSNRGATREIAGEAARLVDPHDAVAMAEAIADLARDSLLCARLRAAGFERSRLFAPEAYKRRLRALYAATVATPVLLG